MGVNYSCQEIVTVLYGRLTLFRTLLARPVDASSLGGFRLLFGGQGTPTVLVPF